MNGAGKLETWAILHEPLTMNYL
ncbi:MAG: hypothetical protein RIR31_654, partial [Bacteroidota bacterium]